MREKPKDRKAGSAPVPAERPKTKFPRNSSRPAARGKPGKSESAPARHAKPDVKAAVKPGRAASGVSKAKPAAAPESRFTVDQPTTLLPFLLERLSGRGRNAVKAVMTRGQVSVDDRVATRHDHPLRPGQTVTVSWGKVERAVPLLGLRILHEDDDLIVVYKEAGLLSIATPQEKELTAYRQLMDYVRRDDPRNRIFIVHRLDRDTSGVIMFAKSEEVQQQLQTTWQETVKERIYVALVEGEVRSPEGKIESWLKESKTLLMYSSPKSDDGQHAVTHYKVLRSNKEYSLLEVRLETGRKNQIRVHMQDIGHPVVGDKKYGSRKNPIGRLGLHALTLAFQHPTRSGELVRFQTELPGVFLRPFRDPAES